MANQKFHISDILSVSTGALLSTRHMDGIYDIMGHIVGDKGISTIGLAANAKSARAFLEESMPWVKEVTFPRIQGEKTNEERKQIISEFLQGVAAKYGEYHDVGQMNVKPDVSINADISFVRKVKGLQP